MQFEIPALTILIDRAVREVAPAVQLVVRWQGATVYERAAGWIDPEACSRPTQPDTLFDLASVTKLFTVTLFMMLVEAGEVTLDQPLVSLLPEIGGARSIQPYEDPQQSGRLISLESRAVTVDVRQITMRQVLTHTSGLPAWRPLFRQPSQVAAWHLALTTACAYRPGTQVLYSDIGLILLGLAVERLTGQSLDRLVTQRISQPLGLQQTCFVPLNQPQRSIATIAPTEVCGWRNRRVHGEAHDENAAALGGIAGHAGLFSTAAEVARFGQIFLDGGAPLLSAATVAEMTRPHVERDTTRRGLGFALWSPDPEASSHPLSRQTFGHTGFTGTSLWIDPQRRLVVALLTNDVYHGRAERRIGGLRLAVHQTIVTAVDHFDRG
ncbi:MAG TPA: serine hydrolase [Herpetosiphonaceae bacterium]